MGTNVDYGEIGCTSVLANCGFSLFYSDVLMKTRVFYGVRLPVELDIGSKIYVFYSNVSWDDSSISSLFDEDVWVTRPITLYDFMSNNALGLLNLKTMRSSFMESPNSKVVAIYPEVQIKDTIETLIKISEDRNVAMLNIKNHDNLIGDYAKYALENFHA